MTQQWERLSQIINWTGLSINAFAREIGLHRAEGLYQIRKGKYKISNDIIERIVGRYENINKEWIIYGQGEMLFDKEKRSASVFPFFDKDICKFQPFDDALSVTNYVTLPLYQGCDFAMPCMSDAMQPEIPGGSVLLFKSVTPESIVLGNTYFVVTNNFRLLRQLRISDKAENLDLVATNSAKYDKMTIARSEIINLYLVRGVIIDKTV